jgi:hypothetical protein
MKSLLTLLFVILFYDSEGLKNAGVLSHGTVMQPETYGVQQLSQAFLYTHI